MLENISSIFSNVILFDCDFELLQPKSPRINVHIIIFFIFLIVVCL